MRTTRSRRACLRCCAAVTTAAVLLAIVPRYVAAHGGEDHGAPVGAAAPAATAESGMIVTYAQNEQFELVAKYPLPSDEGEAHVRLYLADYATNRPIEGAAFAFSFTPQGARVVAPATVVAPGIYDITLALPGDAAYRAVVTLTVGARTDFLELRDLFGHRAAESHLAARQHSAAVPHAEELGAGGSGAPAWLWALGGAAAMLALVAAVALLRRRMRAGSQPGLHRDQQATIIKEKDDEPRT